MKKETNENEGIWMELTVEKEVRDLTIILYLKGMLDISTTNIVYALLEEIDDIEHLIFDFSGLEFIDSTGIGAIIEAFHLAQEKSFTIKLQGVNVLTDHVFETVGLYAILKTLQGEGS